MFDRLKKYLLRFFSKPPSDWLSRSTPISRVFGLDRGLAIDRRFMESFLSSNSAAIKGAVLEVGDDQYTLKFGSNIDRSVVFAGRGKGKASESCDGDLADHSTFIAEQQGQFDCVIATNVLNFIFDFDAAIRGMSLLLRPDSGVCLCTVAGLVQVSRYDYDRWGDYWRFNDKSIRRAFESHFESVDVFIYGNAPLAAAFIMGLSQEEIPSKLFEINDHDYQILIAVKASGPKAISREI